MFQYQKYRRSINSLIAKKRYLFMGFDCLIYNGKDMRSELLLVNRLKHVDEILSKISELKKQKNYVSKPYEGKFDMAAQEKHYSLEIEKFYQNLNKLIDETKDNDYLFHPKLFIFPTGGSNSDVFIYAYLIHNSIFQG